MRDSDCVEFLQWALPRMRMRWPGFRRVRRQVCRRIARRLTALGGLDLDAYKALLSSGLPAGSSHLVLCRNLVFTYYDESLQRVLLDRLVRRLVPGGALIVGVHESLPPRPLSLTARNVPGVYVLETPAADPDYDPER